MIYAGIGPRIIPSSAFEQMQIMGRFLDATGHFLRSGGARGSDTAFASNVRPDRQKIILPTDDLPNEAFNIARIFDTSGRWSVRSERERRLLARNAVVILGDDLQSPVRCVATWFPHGPNGGTGHALRIAAAHKIPIFNLYVAADAIALPTFAATGVKL